MLGRVQSFRSTACRALVGEVGHVEEPRLVRSAARALEVLGEEPRSACQDERSRGEKHDIWCGPRKIALHVERYFVLAQCKLTPPRGAERCRTRHATYLRFLPHPYTRRMEIALRQIFLSHLDQPAALQQERHRFIELDDSRGLIVPTTVRMEYTSHSTVPAYSDHPSSARRGFETWRRDPARGTS